MSGIATRLYRGEAGINVVGRRKLWFAIAGGLLLIAVLSMFLRGFTLGIEFEGGNKFTVPASVGTLAEVEDAFTNAGVEVKTSQTVGGSDYEIRTARIESTEQETEVKTTVAERFNIDPSRISDDSISTSWGGQVTEKALLSLAIFLAVVVVYLIIRFEWRMAIAAVSSLLLNLVVTAGVYSLVGFEVTPSTVIGFLTILGFALYDVVVVFDKVQENTRGITGSSNQTYGEAANLAVNQTLMRSINTGLVALLPVGGLLFIGAGLLEAGTLKDLGLVLFIGMGTAVYSSIFFATPVLAELKAREPRLQTHATRVLAKRSAVARGGEVKSSPPVTGSRPGKGKVTAAAKTGGSTSEADVNDQPAGDGELAASAPRPAARAGQGSRSGSRPGQPKKRGGGRPSGSKRR